MRTTQLDVPLLTIAQAAALLNASTRTIRRLIESGTLPARRLTPPAGSHWRIEPSDLARYLEDVGEDATAGREVAIGANAGRSR
jgi:excisionase family DNA binding protein